LYDSWCALALKRKLFFKKRPMGSKVMLRMPTAKRQALPRLRFGSRAVRAFPHPDKLHRGGEDAFISSDFIVAVADGVGGYADMGVNPAAFTRRVMYHTLAHAQKNVGGKAQEALTAGLDGTLAEKVDGGCPATVATIMKSPKSARATVGDILNLGDCGTILFRKDKALYQTAVQQHSFNCPFQLPDDTPARGATDTVTLEPGDVILQASDGVFDNVFSDRIFEMLRKVYRNKLSTQDAAEQLATLASTLGADSTYKSPFAIAATARGHKYLGGKQDDVTVLISVIEPTPKGALLSATSPQLMTDLFPE
jgi:protein phosphatase PTC7